MAFLDIFVGVPQSKYAAYAIFAAVFVVSLAIMFGGEQIPLGQKFSLVLIIFLVSLPGIVMTLFQLTCLVTGTGPGGRTPWCGWYAWLISAVMIVYCVLLVAVAVIAMATGASVTKELQMEAMENLEKKMDSANAMAVQHFQGASQETLPAEEQFQKEQFQQEQEQVQQPAPAKPADSFSQPPTVKYGRSLPADANPAPEPEVGAQAGDAPEPFSNDLSKYALF